MLRHLPMLAILLAAPVPMLAETPSKPASTSRDDPNKVICRREAVTGSLTQTRKVCMTRAEWVARSRDARDTAQAMQQQGLVNSCGASEPGRC